MFTACDTVQPFKTNDNNAAFLSAVANTNDPESTPFLTFAIASIMDIQDTVANDEQTNVIPKPGPLCRYIHTSTGTSALVHYTCKYRLLQ